MAGPRDSGVAAERAAVPIQATSTSSAVMPISHATNPSGIGPVRPIGMPPGSAGSFRYST